MNKILIVVATYNEKGNLEPLNKRLMALPYACDMLIVDDNSPDGTGKFADTLAAEHATIQVLHRERKTGLSDALRAGFSWALLRGYDLIVNLDADLSHRPEDLPKILAATSQADLVIGSRYISETGVQDWPFHRLLLSKSAGKYIQWVTGVPLTDPTSGFRCFRRSALAVLLEESTNSQGYSLHFEMACIAWRLGFTIREAPITFVGRSQGRSKMNAAIIWEALWLVWKMRARKAACAKRPFQSKGHA